MFRFGQQRFFPLSKIRAWDDPLLTHDQEKRDGDCE